MPRNLTLEDRICELFSSQVEDEAARETLFKRHSDLEDELDGGFERPSRERAKEIGQELRTIENQLIRHFERNEDGYGDLNPDEPRAELTVESIKLVPRIVQSDDDTNDMQIVYVSVYSVTREYGGPEEGGWWYNWTTHLLSIPCLYRDHRKVIEDLDKGDLKGMNRGDIYSVFGGQSIRYYIEYIPGTQASRVQPRYC
jgi:hypothetical protein